MAISPQEVIHRLRRLTLSPPFSGFAWVKASLDTQAFNKASTWHEHLPCQIRLCWRQGSEVRAITRKFTVSVYANTTESLDAFARTQVKLLLRELVKTTEVTLR